LKWDLEVNRLSRLLAAKRLEGASIIDLTESNPTRAGFDYPASEMLGALAAPAALLYEPEPRGLLAPRRAVADYYRERGVGVDPDRIHLTSSTSEGYAYLFKLLADQGDALLVPRPSYPLFDFLAALEGIELRPYDLVYQHPQGWHLDFDSLGRALTPRSRAILVVNPNNPTGSYLKRGEVDRLTQLCRERGLALIVDEVFSDYAIDVDADRVATCVGVDSALVFVLSGLSKILALPQMKLGWIVTHGPSELVEAARERLDLIADTFLSVNTPVQHATPRWLATRNLIQHQIRARAQGNLAWLAELSRDSAYRLLCVEGGWYAAVEIPRKISEEDLVLTLLARDGVLVHPGYFFDFQREAFLILSLIAQPDIFRAGVSRIVARIDGI
jgi:aspartate/methionine/tyrosine aminotransferase